MKLSQSFTAQKFRFHRSIINGRANLEILEDDNNQLSDIQQVMPIETWFGFAVTGEVSPNSDSETPPFWHT
jgi:hypothetical protein